MKDILADTLIVIPSKRKPPLRTIDSYHSDRPLLILADPDVVSEHSLYYADRPNVEVIEGVHGLIPQVLRIYSETYQRGYGYFFRLDDDLYPGFFVDIDRRTPDLEEVMVAARMCIDECRVSLAGFANTSRIDWLDIGMRRSSGLVHGGAQICMSSLTPEEFLDPRLPRYEDVYRSASHRKRDGAVGKVLWIGLNKAKSLRNSVASKTPEEIELAKEIILGKFPDMVSCIGTRTLDGGRQVIPNWKMIGRPTYIAHTGLS